jgi:hypothetical protein
VVNFDGVAIDLGCGLGAEVAVARIEVEGADVVSAVGTGELHAAFDAGDGVEAVHESSVVFCSVAGRNGSEAAKVTSVGF